MWWDGLSGFFGSLWLISVIITVAIAADKKLSIFAWLLLSIIFGPVTAIIILFIPGRRAGAGRNAGSGVSLSSIKGELQDIRTRLTFLLSWVESLDKKISLLSPAREELPLSAKQVIPETPLSPKPHSEAAGKEREKADFEINMGRFWLNKIGIIIFTFGIAFLIAHYFRYFGPIAKVTFGYLVSAALFFFGLKLEKNVKFKNYGRVILGGAWAVTYFTTYAMYHFDAAKIIDNQLLDLVLLACVAGGMIIHSLKYDSQGISAFALFVSYLTATIGDINYFTLCASALLALVALVLMYKKQWLEIALTGVILTYLTHLVWVIKQIYYSKVITGILNVEMVYFLTDTGFLALYWLLFTAGIHLMRGREDQKLSNKLSVANFCNFLLFFFMLYPKVFRVYPHLKFSFIFGLGLVYLLLATLMERAKNNKLFVSNITVSVSLLTLAIPLKFIPLHTNLIWLVEIPALMLMGLYFNRRVFRYLGAALAAIIFFKIFFVDSGLRGEFNFLYLKFSWRAFFTLAGFLSMGSVYSLNRHFGKKISLGGFESGLNNFFSALAVFYGTYFIWAVADGDWLTLALTLESLAIFICGVRLKDVYLRIYAYLLTFIPAVRFCWVDPPFYKEWVWLWLVVSLEIASFYMVYFLQSKSQDKEISFGADRPFAKIIFVLATVMSVYAVYTYIPDIWISLVLGVWGALLFAIGFLAADKAFRLAGFVIFAITLIRVAFVELMKLSTFYKIISFIILGVIFLGVSFIYTKYTFLKSKQK